MSGILERAQETGTKVGLGTRLIIERVRVGNSLPKVTRACALLDHLGRESLTLAALKASLPALLPARPRQGLWLRTG